MPTSSALPSIAAAPVSAEVRLAYVLRHFRLAYDGVPSIEIGYDRQSAVRIANGATDFFAQALPHPAAPNWRDWHGQKLPFFFDPTPDVPLLTLAPSQAFIGADIISAAFFLLSGWQEYFSAERDRHRRFPYAASVQQQYDFVTRPVVNYYFDVLKTAVEHVTNKQLRPRAWGKGAPLAAFISHDIDNLRSAWKTPAKAAWKQRQPLKFGQLLWQHWRQPDAWDNLEAVAAAVAQYGARSTFFILPSHQPAADGTPNADYMLSSTLRQRLYQLRDAGFELGLHGSIGTATDKAKLHHEKEKNMPSESLGTRFHYLRWEPRQTPALLDELAFSYDATLGFAEHFGFRHSYCHPFFPFDFARGRAHGFLEIPLVVMDTTLHHPHYLRLAPSEIMPALQPVFAEIEQFGGVASVLWHNQNFDPANSTNGPVQFYEIMTYLHQRGAAFLTGRDIWAQFPA